MSHRISHNSNTLRTFTPSKGKDYDEFLITPKECSKKFNYSSSIKSTAVGSISELMKCTPDIPKYNKKYAGKLYEGNNIFTPEITTIKKSRQSVDIEKLKKENNYAGTKAKETDEVRFYNENALKTRLSQSSDNFVTILPQKFISDSNDKHKYLSKYSQASTNVSSFYWKKGKI